MALNLPRYFILYLAFGVGVLVLFFNFFLGGIGTINERYATAQELIEEQLTDAEKFLASSREELNQRFTEKIRNSQPQGPIQYEDLDQEFLDEIADIAQEIGSRPEYVMSVISFETAGTFDPTQGNMAGSGAIGLIQFMPDTARGLGTSTSELRTLTRQEQLFYVRKHFNGVRGGKDLKTLTDTYMAVLYPAAIGKNENTPMFCETRSLIKSKNCLSQTTATYNPNKGLDRNSDGVVTPGEAVEAVETYHPPSTFVSLFSS